jgi:dynein heavy chain
LYSAPADIISDAALIEGLESTKRTATDLAITVDMARATEARIQAARGAFRMVAVEGSMLFFVVYQLCALEHMYRYSLQSFVAFFLKVGL